MALLFITIIIIIIIDTFPVQLLFWSESDCVLKQNSDETIFIIYQGKLIFACFKVWKFFFLTLDYRSRKWFFSYSSTGFVPIIFQEFGQCSHFFFFFFFFFFLFFFFFRLQSIPFVTLWIICICMHKMLCQLFKKKHFIEVIPFGPWLNLNC